MKIHLLSADPDYGRLDGPEEVAALFGRSSRVRSKAVWSPPLLRSPLFRGKSQTLGVDCLPTTAPGGGNCLIFGSLARQRLGEVLRAAGEFLPVHMATDSSLPDDYEWFNCTTYLKDAISRATAGEYVERYDLWHDIKRWEFQADVVANAPSVFMVPNDGFQRLYCRGDVADIIKDADLLGFNTPLLWSSNKGGVEGAVPSFWDSMQSSREEQKNRVKRVRVKRRAAQRILAARIASSSA